MNQFAKPVSVVCPCGKGHANKFDGWCTRCRGGVTAYEAEQGKRHKKTGVTHPHTGKKT